MASIAGDRHEAADLRGFECRAGQGALDHGELAADEVQLAEGGLGGGPLMTWQRRQGLNFEPAPASFTEEIAAGVAKHQITVQDAMHAVLESHLLLHEAGAVGHLLAEDLGLVVRDPDVREPSAGQQPHQDLGIHLVGLNLGFSYGAGAKRVGDYHRTGMLLQEAHDGKRVAGGFQGYMIVGSAQGHPPSNWEPGGQHDTNGFALAAHPGQSQGRPTTNTSSRLIVRDRPARPACFRVPLSRMVSP